VGGEFLSDSRGGYEEKNEEQKVDPQMICATAGIESQRVM